MIEKTYLRMEWLKDSSTQYLNSEKLHPKCEEFAFEDLGVFLQGKFSKPLSFGFYVYSLSTGKLISHIIGATNKDDLLKILHENS